jgi:hypothetical protein
VTGQRDENSIHITLQFRSRDAMVYDLRGSAGQLTLRVTGRGADDGSATEWCIEASTSGSPDAVVVAEWGATRAEALDAVVVRGTRSASRATCQHSDWASVARAMAAVRAI